jgi:hypothetical protein
MRTGFVHITKEYYVNASSQFRPTWFHPTASLGYMDNPMKMNPEPLLEVGKTRTRAEWIGWQARLS